MLFRISAAPPTVVSEEGIKIDDFQKLYVTKWIES